MSKEIALPNEKAIVARLNKPFKVMKSSHYVYVKSVIGMGKQLIIEKKNVPHGDWERVVKASSEDAFGADQAARIMRVAANEDAVMMYFSNDTSILQLCKHIAEMSPEQIAQVEQIKKDQADKAALAEATAALAETARILKAAQEDEVIEGVFEEVKAPVVELEIVERPVEDPFDVLQETIEMLETDNTALQTEIESMVKVFESNDQLTTALAEVKKFQELARVLKESLNGSMNSENAAKRQAKMWKAKYEKLAKEVGRERRIIH